MINFFKKKQAIHPFKPVFSISNINSNSVNQKKNHHCIVTSYPAFHPEQIEIKKFKFSSPGYVKLYVVNGLAMGIIK